ncbi:MAG: signal peptidase I [Minisyncoccia bacterium]
MKKLFNGLYYLFVLGIMVIAAMLLISTVPVPGNLMIKIVKSGSMEPEIRTGGIVVIIPQKEYRVGDVITFGKDSKTQIPTTHRIVEIIGDGPLRTFTTKGDANDSEDPKPTRLSEIQGKVIFSSPYLGYILDFAKKPLGFALLVGVPALAIILDEFGKIISEIKKMRRKKISNETIESGKNENNF